MGRQYQQSRTLSADREREGKGGGGGGSFVIGGATAEKCRFCLMLIRECLIHIRRDDLRSPREEREAAPAGNSAFGVAENDDDGAAVFAVDDDDECF